jgi:spermidine synthase
MVPADMTRPWQKIGSVPTPDGVLELRRRGEDEFLIVIGGRVLMTSAHRTSEQALATLACAEVHRRAAPRVLIGGLGMAYTLRAALDALPARARVEVCELHPAVVDWCRGPLSVLTAGAVSDPRVRVVVGDVARHIRSAPASSYDAILLDLFEGPYAATQAREDPFYGPRALLRTREALVPGGRFAIWAEDYDAPFVRRLATAGFEVATHRSGHGGRAHVVYVGVRGPAATPAVRLARRAPMGHPADKSG